MRRAKISDHCFVDHFAALDVVNFFKSCLPRSGRIFFVAYQPPRYLERTAAAEADNADPASSDGSRECNDSIHRGLGLFFHGMYDLKASSLGSSNFRQNLQSST